MPNHKHARNAVKTNSSCRALATYKLQTSFSPGQHSLTSVERPSYLRSDFVNVWRHVRLVAPPVTHVSFASIVHSDLSDDLVFVSRSCLAFSIISRLVQPRRCHCICLERVFWCFALIKPLSASIRSFQRMSLSNIPWMSPDRMAFMKKLHEQANKTQMNRCPI